MSGIDGFLKQYAASCSFLACSCQGFTRTERGFLQIDGVAEVFSNTFLGLILILRKRRPKLEMGYPLVPRVLGRPCYLSEICKGLLRERVKGTLMFVTNRDLAQNIPNLEPYPFEM